YYDNNGQEIAVMNTRGNDFQNQNYIHITSHNNFNHTNIITQNNLIPTSIYFAVRHCIKATWINDRDQFLMPNKEWIDDRGFQNDCLAFTLFYGQNHITSKENINHFIPFSEKEVGAKEAFGSHFMHRFINGKLTIDSKNDGLIIHESIQNLIPTEPLNFSEEAKAVFAAGLKLWQYYHSQDFHDSKNPYNPNASLYDIKAHFQGVSASSRMNPPQKAKDSHYKDLIGNLNYELENLAKKIEPKVYEYGFLSE
ncbi:MAG: hypothetical protein K2N70_02975, partial [Helicobacter sp.]|nr:hypothetical protein [Helicobacter sp.]